MTVDMTAKRTSATRHLAAPPEAVFAVLTDPTLHPVIDGSGMVVAALASSADKRLELGSRFGMRMRLGVPYRIHSVVTEFEPNRLIAWRHVGRHTWRYELAPTADGGTDVTETFDWGTAISPRGLELVGYPTRRERHIAETLERLDAYLTNKSAAL